MYQFFRGYSQLLSTQAANRNLSGIQNNNAAIAEQISHVDHALGDIEKRRSDLKKLQSDCIDRTGSRWVHPIAKDLLQRFIYDFQSEATKQSHAEYLNRNCYDYTFTLELAGRYMPNIAFLADQPRIFPDWLHQHNAQLFAEVQTHIKATKDRRDFALLSANMLKIRPHLSDNAFATCKGLVDEIKNEITNFNYFVLAKSRSLAIKREGANIKSFGDVPDDFYLSQKFAIKTGFDINFKRIEDLSAYCRAVDPMKKLEGSQTLPFAFMAFPERIIDMANRETLTGLDLLDVITRPLDGQPAAVDCLPDILKVDDNKTIAQNLLNLTVRI
ncbi:hypothetical protein [Shewanella aestuarii]|uniref:Uncharacterized protein n=1 Tax=Shewanella aestuarii TaxID=1028752 RepID=A0A6G9QR32_9GAMM|nr:hypothetical protein [Shewanella aestuarii]QIR16515.1 hypothetical protein HBH39_18740 [Shewanella aestuarii]